jgi:hypothetical protein
VVGPQGALPSGAATELLPSPSAAILAQASLSSPSPPGAGHSPAAAPLAAPMPSDDPLTRGLDEEDWPSLVGLSKVSPSSEAPPSSPWRSVPASSFSNPGASKPQFPLNDWLKVPSVIPSVGSSAKRAHPGGVISSNAAVSVPKFLARKDISGEAAQTLLLKSKADLAASSLLASFSPFLRESRASPAPPASPSPLTLDESAGGSSQVTSDFNASCLCGVRAQRMQVTDPTSASFGNYYLCCHEKGGTSSDLACSFFAWFMSIVSSGSDQCSAAEYGSSLEPVGRHASGGPQSIILSLSLRA